jgi:hypothetical protein
MILRYPRILSIAIALTALGMLCGAAGTPRGAVRAARALPAQAGGTAAYVGQVSSTGDLVGIVLEGSQITAYICDGTDSAVGQWGWFLGDRTGTNVDLVSTNGHELQIDFDAYGVPSGQLVTRDGAAYPFTSEPATGTAGIWRAQGLVNGVPLLAGWVILNNGDERGAAITEGGVATIRPFQPKPGPQAQQIQIDSDTLLAAHVGFISRNVGF